MLSTDPNKQNNMTSKTVKKTIKVGKSFRLIDFHVFDEKKWWATSSSSSPSSVDDATVTVAGRSKYTPAAFTVQMYGINEKGETCSIFVTDYQPFFYVLVGDKWTQGHVNRLKEELCERLGGRTAQSNFVSMELVENNKLYGFTAGKPSKFVKMTFPNAMSMMRVRNLWYEKKAVQSYGDRAKKSGAGAAPPAQEMRRVLKPLFSQDTRLDLYESQLPPLLRYFHIHNISPSGWVFIALKQAIVPDEFITTCQYEYICSKNDLTPQNQKETRVPYKICSFDIEASSSHGDFPVPIKSYKRLTTQMVDVFDRQRDFIRKDAERQRELIAKIVLAAFGHGKMDDIDLVYPKGGSPSKTVLETSLLPKLFQYSCVLDEDQGMQSKALLIESMFEKMKEQSSATLDALGHDGDGDDDGDADEELGGADHEAELDLVYEVEDDVDVDVQQSKTSSASLHSSKHQRPPGMNGNAKASTTKKTASPAKTASSIHIAAQPTISILDILNSESHTRDDKIQILNVALMDEANGFPALEGDRVTFIGSTFMRYGEPEPYLNHCVVLNSCDPVPGTTIETTHSERDLLMRWTQLIQQENPDIVIGYNIFGFDYEFMYRRSQEMNCSREFLQLSRKPEFTVDTDDYREPRVPDLQNTKIVLATGEYDLRYPNMAGRLQIDMYTYFRRDFNLASYKLDDVAGQFIRDDVKKVEFVTESDGTAFTCLYTNNITGLHVGDYIHIEISSFTSDYYRDGYKFPVMDIQPSTDPVAKYVLSVEGHETDLQDQKKSIKWCMTKDDVSPQDIFRLSNGSAADRAKVAKYCIQDCNLVHHLMNKIDVITGYVEMSRICSVPISFLVFRGQGIKLTSYVSKKCREKKTLMPDLEKTYEADGYEGAIVLPPKCSMYMDNPVACLDYASLYPSSMISNNLSPDSKVWTKEFDLEGRIVHETGIKDPRTGKYLYDNLEHLGYKYIDVEFDTFKWQRPPGRPAARAEKKKVGKKICRWVQLPNHQKSIMPAILEELLKARSDTRKLIKTEKDPFMQNILDKRQLGYKVTANSLYGQCGAKTSTFYEKDVAASTTATGRLMITYAKRIIEEVYGDLDYTTSSHGDVKCCAEYVYGDSVAYYTPVTVRVGRHIRICTIEELAQQYGRNRWVTNEDGKEFCELNLLQVDSWTERGWTRIHRLIRHRLAPHKRMIRIVTNSAIVDVTDDHSLLTQDGVPISPKDITLTTPLLHHNVKMVRTGENCESVSGSIMNLKNPKYLKPGSYTFGAQDVSQVEIAEHYFAMHEMGYRVYMETNSITGSITMYAYEDTAATPEPSMIQKIEVLLNYGSEYVYDLTTDNHHFAAGIGNMIVHNTDSVFFTFNLKDPESGENIRGKRALEVTIEIAQDAAELCTQFLKPPMELSYEKTLMPFILLSKKRYVGMLYETDPNKGKMKYMGLSLKRRDSCDYLKDVYGGILTILMKEYDLQKAIEFLDDALRQLIAGKVSMDKLAITKALRGHYKNPKQIAHAVLAERIGKRDPGNKPKPGDRMKFVYIVNKATKALQGDKIETPEFIIQNRLLIDYTFYITNQLMKPLQQLFGLALEPICRIKNKLTMIKPIKQDIQQLEREYGDSIEVFMKKREKYCSTKIKTLLFERYLVDIQNQKNGIRSIMDCFAPSSSKK